MKQTIVQALESALQTLKSREELPADVDTKVQVERARDPLYGDFASNIAMTLAKQAKTSPMTFAEKLVASLPSISGVNKVEIAKPGFINFFLSDEAYQRVIPDILQAGKEYGRINLGSGERIHMEIVSANPTGPLHVGHGRIAAYSASLANVLKAAGFEVHREYYVNDAGRQMRILTLSIWLRYLEISGEPITIPLSGYKGSYIIDIAKALKAEYGDRFFKSAKEVFQDLPLDTEESKEMYVDAFIERAVSLLGDENYKIIFEWGLKSILDDIYEDLKSFGVECEEWFYESKLTDLGDIKNGLEKLREAGFLYERQGAVWFRSTDLGDEKDRVVIRENGQPTYFASDIGYHLNKYQRGFTRFFDIYGADHHGYAPRLRALVQALGKDPSALHVLLVQFAILYRGKTRVSMSTRAGEFVTLRELRQEVGNDAARYFYIMRKREQHLDFDLELAKSQSSENPVYYIQYANARVCSVFRQLEQRKLTWEKEDSLHHLHLLNQPQEKNLLRSISRYPEIIETAAIAYEPSIVAHYLQEVANDFHVYYNAHQFIVEDKNLRNARISLIAATQQVLVNGLTLLGLTTPEMM